MSYRPSPSHPNPNPNPSIPLPHAQQGSASPLPPIPQVSSSNLGQPGATTQLHSTTNGINQVGTGDKGPDYVYFERRPGQYGDQTMGKAMAAKMKLELYYKEAVESVVGRKER